VSVYISRLLCFERLVDNDSHLVVVRLCTLLEINYDTVPFGGLREIV
jgi:hypothetical protein